MRNRTSEYASGQRATYARLQEFVDRKAVVQFETGSLCQLQIRCHANARCYEIGLQAGAIVENSALFFN